MEKNKDKKKEEYSGRLQLKKTFNAGQIKQSFSHGRTRSVSVEVKKKRTLSGFKTTSNNENENLVKRPENNIDVEIPNEQNNKIIDEVHDTNKIEEEKPVKEEKKQTSNQFQKTSSSKPNHEQIDSDTKKESNERQKPQKQSKPAKSFEDRRQGKLTISQALDDENNEKVRSLAAIKRAREKAKLRNIVKPEIKDNLDFKEKKKKDVIIPDFIAVNELASRMAEKSPALIKVLMKLGVMATINQTIDGDTAELVVIELGHTAKRVSESDVEIGLSGEEDKFDQLQTRPPVVTIMGHVDHGKTSILDAIRQKKVALSEAGGITQHIGSYMIKTNKNQNITFIDTPGHAAFSQMRARGSNITDIIILVVAADDSVNEQTIEAISHAKASGCPIIVAINKIDLPAANPEKVETDLMKHEIISEKMGGQVPLVNVSAKTKDGLEDLLDTISLQAEILELRANPTRNAEGTVIESKIEKGKGTVVSILVQNGHLKVGDVVIVGKEWGKVRALYDDDGERLEEAFPSYPVDLLGLSGAPESGDKLIVVENESRAREVTQYRARSKRIEENASIKRASLEQLMQNVSEKEKKPISIIIKADVHGSKEAIEQSLKKINSENVDIKIPHTGVGEINESDVSLAVATNSIIFGFNVRANVQAKTLSKRDNILIKYFSIIYEVIDEINKIIDGLTEDNLIEKLVGEAIIKKIFKISDNSIAGCFIENGKVLSGCDVKVVRDEKIINETGIKSLRREKNEVKEVLVGQECGIQLENFNDISEGDKLTFYTFERDEKR